MLQYVAVCYSVSHNSLSLSNLLQCVAVCCSMLQCVTVCHIIVSLSHKTSKGTYSRSSYVCDYAAFKDIIAMSLYHALFIYVIMSLSRTELPCLSRGCTPANYMYATMSLLSRTHLICPLIMLCLCTDLCPSRKQN